HRWDGRWPRSAAPTWPPRPARRLRRSAPGGRLGRRPAPATRAAPTRRANETCASRHLPASTGRTATTHLAPQPPAEPGDAIMRCPRPFTSQVVATIQAVATIQVVATIQAVAAIQALATVSGR